MRTNASNVLPVWDSDKSEDQDDGNDSGGGGENQPKAKDLGNKKSSKKGKPGSEGNGKGKPGGEGGDEDEKEKTTGEKMASDEQKLKDLSKKLAEKAVKDGVAKSASSVEADAKNALKKAMEEGDRQARKKGKSDGMGGFGTQGAHEYLKDLKKVNNFAKSLSDLMDKINKFQAEFSDVDSDEEHVRGPIYRGLGDLLIGHKQALPVEAKNEFEIPILFLAIDTSGSMGEDEMKLAVSLLNKLAQHFERGDSRGKCIKLMFDDDLYMPVEVWKPIKNIESTKVKFDVQGRGGTGFNTLLAGLDKFFTHTKGAEDYFLYNEKSLVFKAKGSLKLADTGDNVSWANAEGQKLSNNTIVHNGKTFPLSDLALLQDQQSDSPIVMSPIKSNKSRVPLLICVTDGGFNGVPNYGASKLYNKSKNNVCFVLVGDHATTEKLDPNDARHVFRLMSSGDMESGVKNENIEGLISKMITEMNS